MLRHTDKSEVDRGKVEGKYEPTEKAKGEKGKGGKGGSREQRDLSVPSLGLIAAGKLSHGRVQPGQG